METAIVGFSFSHLLVSVFQALFVFLIYFPMIPLYWVTSHLQGLIGCPWTGDIWAVLSIGGLLLSLEVWPVIGGLVTYVAGLGLAAHVLSCGDFLSQELLLDRVLILGH